jgi:hypothetical protein
MSRPRFFLFVAGSIFLLAVALNAAGVDRESPPAPRAAVAPLPSARQAKPQTPPAKYMGSDICLGCHSDMEKGLTGTMHGNAAHPRSPAAAQGCESCHGPGELHLEDPSVETSIRKFTRMAPREVSEACLSCHTKSSHQLWKGSAHDARNLACTTCHSVHTPKAPKAQL